MTATPPPDAAPHETERLESLMAEVPPSSPGWQAPASRLPSVSLWLGVGAFVSGLVVALQMAQIRQGERAIVAGGLLFGLIIVGLGLAIAAIVGGLRVRSLDGVAAGDRARGGYAIALAILALILLTLAGLELYAVGLEAF